MSAGLDFETRWLSRTDGNPVERATLATISVRVDEIVATELQDIATRAVRKGARLSAYELALWLAANWWRLRWEPESNSASWRMSHNVAAAGSGYIWPNLSFSSQGSTVLVRGRSTGGSAISPIRYLQTFERAISGHEFEQGVDKFVSAVLGRLSKRGILGSDLENVWNEVTKERKDAGKSAYRRIEAIMGCDPDEASENDIETLQACGGEDGIDAVAEVAAESGFTAIRDWKNLIAQRPNAARIRIPEMNVLREKIRGPGNQSAYLWQRGERSAKIARQAWDIPPGKIAAGDLEELFGVSNGNVAALTGRSRTAMPVAFRDDEAASEIRVVLRQGRADARRFALARLVADHLLSRNEDRVLPATGARTERQILQRAFAQEFLCPFSDLEAFRDRREPTDDLIEEAAREFEVSALLVRNKFFDKGVLGRA